MGWLSLDCYHFYLLMISKEALTFPSLSNLVLRFLLSNPLKVMGGHIVIAHVWLAKGEEEGI